MRSREIQVDDRNFAIIVSRQLLDQVELERADDEGWIALEQFEGVDVKINRYNDGTADAVVRRRS